MIDKLIEQIKNKNSHVCVGLDPQLKFIPEEIKDEVFAEYGPTLEAVAEYCIQEDCRLCKEQGAHHNR